MTVDYFVSRTSITGSGGSEAVASWRDHVRSNHGRLDYAFNDTERFRGSTVVQRARGYQLVEFRSDPILYTRTRQHARSDDDRRVRIVIPSRGRVDIGGAEGTVRSGPATATVLTAATAFTLQHSDTARAWILTLPETAWPRAATTDHPIGISLASGLGAVAATMVRELSLRRDEFSEADFLDVAGHAVSLLATCAGHVDEHPDLARAARDYVRTHAHDPTLTPASLAGRLGWSLRTLQATLEVDGTSPSGLIRATRLSNAWSALNADVHRGHQISEIAFAHGFGSLSGFNAAFRREFGVSPREVRASRAGPRHERRGPAAAGH